MTDHRGSMPTMRMIRGDDQCGYRTTIANELSVTVSRSSTCAIGCDPAIQNQLMEEVT